METFVLNDDYIQLDQLLKFLRIAENGSHAHSMVDEGLVDLNGMQESRRRAKIKKGDILKVQGRVIKIL